MGAELFHADRHEEANSRISQLCESASNLLMEKYSQMWDQMEASLKIKNLSEALSCRPTVSI